jgi:predicted DNA-binding protein with PD1-like motif
MITISGGFRTQFREQIKNFCSDNDLHITYRSCLGDCDNYNIGGETHNIDKLMKYVEQLEQERKNKSFWWRLWN